MTEHVKMEQLLSYNCYHIVAKLNSNAYETPSSPSPIRKLTRTQNGFLLMAKPFWNDDQYDRSVVLIVEHNREGSVGLIVNKESNLNIHSAVSELESTQPLYYGGPFKKEIVFIVHNEPDIPDSMDLGNGLYIGGDYEFLKELINHHRIDPGRIRFCAGYVAWSAGQLEKELKKDRWWASKVTANEFFATDAEVLWSHRLATDGHVYGIFEDCPDPSLN